jgi:hypothetical protein
VDIVLTKPATIYSKRETLKSMKPIPSGMIRLDTAGTAPTGTVADVTKISEEGYVSETEKGMSLFRLNKGIPGLADAGEFLERTVTNHKVYGAGALTKVQTVYFVDPNKINAKWALFKEASLQSKVLGSIKAKTKYSAQKVAGKEFWYYIPSKSGYVYSGGDQFVYTEEPKVAAAAPAPKPTAPAPSAPKPAPKPASFGLTPSAPMASLPPPVAAPAQAGMSTTTMIAIGLIAVSAIILLLPKKGS